MSEQVIFKSAALLFVFAMISVLMLTPAVTAFELDGVKTWYWTSHTHINSVAIGDVDADGAVEMVTGGYYDDGTRNNAQLCVWSGSDLTLERVKVWYWTSDTEIWSVAVGDVDGDGSVEIVTGGYYLDGQHGDAQLAVWDGSTLALEDVTTWYWGESAHINSMAIGDVDADGAVEIITGGYYWNALFRNAQLCVWSGSDLAFENVKVWYWTGETIIYSVAVSDVDADGSAEIVTGGYYSEPDGYHAQLVVWSGSNLALENVQTWYWGTTTRINSVAIGDIDADGDLEIVTGGRYFLGPAMRAQLCVWNGATLALEDVTTWYWIGDTHIYSVAVGVFGVDDSMEVVTGGYHNDGTRYNAQLAVWVKT